MKTIGLNSWKSWGIAVICTFVNFLSILPIRIAGLVYVDLMESYNISRKAASMPIIVATMVRCMIGPFVGYLCRIFECRSMITFGAILSSVGVGACFYAEEITFVIISLGLINGLGMAFGNTLVPIVLKQHFDKHASKANGLSLIGISLSAIVISPFFEYLLIKYGTAGAFLITSGIMLNGLPAALLLKNPNYAKIPLTKNKPKEEYPCLNETPQTYDDDASINQREKLVTYVNLENFTPKTVHACTSRNEMSSLANGNGKHIMTSEHLDLNVSSANDNYSNKVSNAVAKSCKEQLANLKHEKLGDIGEEEYKLGLPELKSSYNKGSKHKSRCQSLKVFKDPSYLIILISQGYQPFLVTTVWTIIIDLSRDKGIPGSQEMYFLMLLPVAELFGYIGLSWTTDNGYFSSSKFCVVCYICMALSCASLVWSYEFVTMMIAILSFSFFGAAISTISPVLILEFVEESEQSMAIASRYLLFVPLGLATPSFIGYFRENLGSYDWLLYLLAIVSLLCSFLYLLMPYTVLYKARKRKSSQL